MKGPNEVIGLESRSLLQGISQVLKWTNLLEGEVSDQCVEDRGDFAATITAEKEEVRSSWASLLNASPTQRWSFRYIWLGAKTCRKTLSLRSSWKWHLESENVLSLLGIAYR